MNLNPTKIVLAVALACVSFTACKKSSKSNPLTEPTTVTIENTEYSIAKIGNQTWTTVNYNGNKGVVNPTKLEYGKYCTYTEALTIALPAGWRLPSPDDFKKLLEGQGAILDENRRTETKDALKKLLATNTWTYTAGTNESKFNFLATGYYILVQNNYELRSVGLVGELWAFSPEANNGIYNDMYLNNQSATVFAGSIDKNIPSPDKYKFPIRFVKDN